MNTTKPLWKPRVQNSSIFSVTWSTFRPQPLRFFSQKKFLVFFPKKKPPIKNVLYFLKNIVSYIFSKKCFSYISGKQNFLAPRLKILRRGLSELKNKKNPL